MLRRCLDALLIIGVIRPSLDWLMGWNAKRFWRDWTVHHEPEMWDRVFEVMARDLTTERRSWTTAATLVRVCMHFGISLNELRGEHLLAIRDCRGTDQLVKHSLGGTWYVAKQAGLLPGEPETISALTLLGKKTPTQLVDQYGVQSPTIRALLIDYITEVSANSDYSNHMSVTTHLVKLFWCDLERHHPGIDTIALTPEQAASWKHRINTKEDGTARRNAYSVVGTVRAFYLDLSAWAHEEPARWGPWAVPCPISPRDIKRYNVARRRVTEGMQDRTRTLSPHLARFAALAWERHQEAADLIVAARAADNGATFTFQGHPYTRQRMHQGANPDSLRLTGPHLERPLDPVMVESQRFWGWAAVEVLRHSGIRIEEMLELTHLSIRQYRKPDGQVIPLLQVAASKNDKERILPCSPELTSALARIITRLTSASGAVPLAIRRDEHDHLYSAPLPFLFQLREGGRYRGVNSGTIRQYLADVANAMSLRDVDGTPMRFTPHDFRRLFITDLVNQGFPIHLAAKIVGHANIETTRGYTAVYQKDVFEAYDKFIHTRRVLRPSDEYREPSQQEWAEFSDHFMRRKVSLGDCRRPYGSGCSHEHACIRCQFLQVDPGQAGHLDTIETNLHTRIDEAKANVWLGDVDQLQLTLQHLSTKKAEVQRLLESLPVPLVVATPGCASHDDWKV